MSLLSNWLKKLLLGDLGCYVYRIFAVWRFAMKTFQTNKKHFMLHDVPCSWKKLLKFIYLHLIIHQQKKKTKNFWWKINLLDHQSAMQFIWLLFNASNVVRQICCYIVSLLRRTMLIWKFCKFAQRICKFGVATYSGMMLWC